ncbi:UDP-N-acetylglucosamine 1-carboxyvinyltransferase [Candidatus Riesia pediculischaeffi]|uniref:UDP-N-acetylglucosamine 1-carboxyvinyltransferase n=1 Tax=Candidatus Riesia pediculischaeffi PTSU TaxID=1401651 RepID=A0A0C1V7C6_9ENTR|nr:UDP-N-acetylglucosamine 1-carboxyvinyltransferase [Candidatus Riesia pediculischaeffi]KIE64299.1 UDP-N-acetylglucosamine 1-carboxyvinyltransferase [Candidatus Riesia pediculischaeffi PTSU]
MSIFQLDGPTRLKGTVFISGSKNSALPILFASLLANDSVTLYNVPKIKDVEIAVKIITNFGARITLKEQHISIETSSIKDFYVPHSLSKSIRASILALSPLIARFGKGRIFFPGGCQIGKRPIDLHIDGLKKMGVIIEIKRDELIAYLKKKLTGAEIFMRTTSVGATISILIAAVTAIGKTVIKNAACEPEIVDTANFLNSIGAKITGAGTDEIKIEGVEILKGGKYRISSDRIETGTFLVAASISKGSITCRNTNPSLLGDVILKLRQTGANVQTGKDWIKLDTHGKRPRAVSFVTSPYPGFPTDMQAQFTLLNLIAIGKSVITETIFENRFMHVSELVRMGANAFIERNQVFCCGVKRLIGKNVSCNDLRGSVSLVLAGCIADGRTNVRNIHHIDRGYENIEIKLRSVGAKIKRIS